MRSSFEVSWLGVNAQNTPHLAPGSIYTAAACSFPMKPWSHSPITLSYSIIHTIIDILFTTIYNTLSKIICATIYYIYTHEYEYTYILIYYDPILQYRFKGTGMRSPTHWATVWI